MMRRKLDLMGRIFVVPDDVLIKSGLLGGMIQDFPELGIEVPIIIDRSPMLFEHVLAYMINDKYLYPIECEGEIFYYALPKTTVTRPDYRGPPGKDGCRPRGCGKR